MLKQSNRNNLDLSLAAKRHRGFLYLLLFRINQLTYSLIHKWLQHMHAYYNLSHLQ